MGIDDRIPELSDKELETFHANASRVAESGAPKQQEAERLLPLIAAELEARRAVRAQADQERRAAMATRRKAASAAKAKAKHE